MESTPTDTEGIPWSFNVVDEETEEVKELLKELRNCDLNQEKISKMAQRQITTITDSAYFSDGEESLRVETVATVDFTLTEIEARTEHGGEFETASRESIGLALQNSDANTGSMTLALSSAEPAECWLEETRTLCCWNWATSLGTQKWIEVVGDELTAETTQEVALVAPTPKALPSVVPCWLN